VIGILLASLFAVPTMEVQDRKTFDHLALSVRASAVKTIGGEKNNAGFYVVPITIGRTARWSFSKLTSQCGYSVRPTVGFEPGAVSGWQVEVTPTAVEGDAVTLRVAWVRGIDNRQPSQEHKGEMVATLRPGDSLPLDLVRLRADDSPSTCDVPAATLAVEVEYNPDRESDRRLLVTDLWLVERLANGTERSQQVSLRGQFNRPQPFYFEDLTDGSINLDISGDLTVRPRNGYVEVELSTLRRLSFRNMLAERPGIVKSLARLKPDDVAAIELPPVGDKTEKAFRDRAITLRVRTRQVRGEGITSEPYPSAQAGRRP
jgi:hypothetical protein